MSDEPVNSYRRGYVDALDDAIIAVGMVQLGKIGSHQELAIKQEAVSALKFLRDTSK